MLRIKSALCRTEQSLSVLVVVWLCYDSVGGEKKNSLIFCCCSTTESPFPHSLNACFCDCIMRLLCAMKISVLLNANKKTAHNFFFLSVFEPLNKPFAIAHSEKFNCTKGKDVQNIWARNTHTV